MLGSKNKKHVDTGTKSNRARDVKHIACISGIVPKPSFSGSAILYRHLSRLEKSGWKISVISSAQKLSGSSFRDSWKVLALPDRRIWWPPVRDSISASLDIRLFLWTREVRWFFIKDKPSIILTVLWDYHSLLAARLSEKWNIPLCVIVHDDWELFCAPDRRAVVRHHKEYILGQSSQVLSVSHQMKDSLDLSRHQGSHVLLPIPDERKRNFSKWKDEFRRPVISYAGTIYPGFALVLRQLAAALQSFGGKLIIIPSSDRDSDVRSLKEMPNIEFYSPFDTNSEAIEFLSDSSSCIMVGYPFSSKDDLAWRHSFPSKLLEFSCTGLPLFIVTPSNTALSDWVFLRNWLCFLDEIDDAKFRKILTDLTDKKTWESMAEQTREVAVHEFDPHLIHAQLEEILDSTLSMSVSP